MTKEQKTLEEIMKEFDEIAVYTNEYGYVHPIPKTEQLKSFLESVWHAGRESVVETAIETVEGMLKNKKLPNNISKEYKEMSERYDLWRETILSDVITKLSELKK